MMLIELFKSMDFIEPVACVEFKFGGRIIRGTKRKSFKYRFKGSGNERIYKKS